MKVSVVTVCLNSEATIEKTICSVIAQEGVDIEYILIDGGSQDNTLKIIERYREFITTVVSEPDKGLYDAMNKGLALATGEIIGFLNSDDTFADIDSLASLISCMETEEADCVFADVDLVDAAGRAVRIYSAAGFHPSKFERGYAVPHPSFYARTELIREAGGFRDSFKIASDFELMIKLMRLRGVRRAYLPKTVVKMLIGGVSTSGYDAYRTSTAELIRAIADNGLKPDQLAIRSRILRKGVEVLRGHLREVLRVA